MAPPIMASTLILQDQNLPSEEKSRIYFFSYLLLHQVIMRHSSLQVALNFFQLKVPKCEVFNRSDFMIFTP
jgi:hypothetical protein